MVLNIVSMWAMIVIIVEMIRIVIDSRICCCWIAPVIQSYSDNYANALRTGMHENSQGTFTESRSSGASEPQKAALA